MAHSTRTFRGCCHRGRASTRPYIAYCKSIKYVGIISTKNTPRVTSRSCRGDWEVDRHIRMAHPRIFRGWCHRGRASTRPYIACCTSTKYTGIISTKIHHGSHRVAVGATGRSPAASAMRPRAYSGVVVTAGELPLAPTLHVVHQRNTHELHQQYTPRVTSRSCRGDWEVARHIRMAHPRTSRGCCHRGRASTRPYIACCTSTKYMGIISTICTTCYTA